MSQTNFSLIQRATAVLVLGFCLTAVPVLAGERRLLGDCGSIAAWVEQHAADLPRTYEELGEFPVAYRRAIFNALSDEEKSQLWRTHLQNQLDSLSLTDEQRRLVEEAMEFTGPEMFTRRGDRVARLRISSFEKAARDKFNHETARKIFGQLGTDDSVIKIIVKKPACSCSNVSDYCPDGTGCDETAGCNVVQDACGFFWSYDCNGLCVDPSNTM